MTWPVTNPASSEARKATTPAVSVGSPIRPRANAELAAVFYSAVMCPNGPDIVLPGPTASTVIRQLTAQVVCQACGEPRRPSTTRG